MYKPLNSLSIILFLALLIIMSSCARKEFSASSTHKFQTIATLPNNDNPNPLAGKNPDNPKKQDLHLQPNMPISPNITSKNLSVKTEKQRITVRTNQATSHPTEVNRQSQNKTVLRIPILNKIFLRQHRGPKYYFQKAVAQGNAYLAIGCLVLLLAFIIAAIIIASA